MFFDFENQELKFRSKLEEIEFIQRSKIENSSIPLDVIYRQLLMMKDDTKKKIFWITINPKPLTQDETINFIQRVKSLMGKTYLPNIAFTFEQRGETLEHLGKGVHAHILCDKNPKVAPKNIINNLASYFKLFCNHNSIDVKLYPYTYREDKIRYLRGDKEDPEKLQKVEIDRQFRDKFKLDLIYQ